MLGVAEDRKKVLILGCTATKKAVSGCRAPVRTLYDGPTFNLFRRFDRSYPGEVHLFALSALHGLVDGDDQLEPYDCTLDGRFDETRQLVARQLAAQDKTAIPPNADIVAVMSQPYLTLLAGAWEDARVETTMRSIRGRPGVRLAHLKQWLYGDLEHSEVPRRADREAVKVRGVELSFTEQEAVACLEAALLKGIDTPLRVGAWAVFLAGRAVAPKWLVGEFSGLAMSQFHTQDALRALRKLGFVPTQVAS